ncbi:MAG: LacI family DNA-binding transcriptional regulator [Limnochordales bacterium]|nr:LacI family DNA-binding transcriptional regulator [Limnochordales bacterium]
MARRTTIYDVAREAGVSIATVSRVFNSLPRVDEETRHRVLQAASSLGYAPSIVARTLTGKQSRTLALLVPDVRNPYFPEVTLAVQRAVHAAGYSLLLLNAPGGAEQEEQYVAALRGRHVDALVVAGGSVHDTRNRPAWLDRYAMHRPIILINADLEPPASGPVARRWARVLVDEKAGAIKAVQHLVSLGHRRIAFLGGPAHLYPTVVKHQGYLEALTLGGIDPDPELQVFGEFSGTSGLEMATKLLSLPSDRRPTALLAANDMIAAGCLQAARDRGVLVPEQLSIVGFDDVFVNSLLWPPLTSVAQSYEEIGKAVVRLVGQMQMATSDGSDETEAADNTLRTTLVVRIDPTLQVRASTGPPPG